MKISEWMKENSKKLCSSSGEKARNQSWTYESEQSIT